LIAERAGFGNAATFRHHFRAWRGTSPHAYRRTFRESKASRDSHLSEPAMA
jgi:transcriptional regulator GlxA family with amidase domain